MSEAEIKFATDAVKLIVVLLLLWYFVKSNLGCCDAERNNAESGNSERGRVESGNAESGHSEGLNNPDGNEDGDFEELGLPGVVTKFPPAVKFDPSVKYNLQYGTYGDVPVVFYDEDSLKYSEEWWLSKPNRIFVPNTRTLYRRYPNYAHK